MSWRFSGRKSLQLFEFREKWFPAPSVPSCGLPLAIALSETKFGSACFSQPYSSVVSKSAFRPYPCSKLHLLPLASSSSISSFESLVCPPLPTPDGTCLNSSFRRSLSFGLMSCSVQSVLRSRTPQLMSYPIPPGLITPFSESTAATPPIGKPSRVHLAVAIVTIPRGRRALRMSFFGFLATMRRFLLVVAFCLALFFRSVFLMRRS